MINKLLPILFLLIGLNTIQAQEPYMKQFTIDDGLPSMEIYDLLQDSKGYIWVATDNGLCRYNGTHFEYFANEKMLSNSVSGLKEGANGKIWLYNFKGQIFYLEQDSMYLFTPQTPYPISFRFPKLIDHNGNIWIAGKQVYQYHYKSGQWKSYDLENFVTTELGIQDSSMFIKRLTDIYEIIDFEDKSILSSSLGIFSIKDGKIARIPITNTIYKQTYDLDKKVRLRQEKNDQLVPLATNSQNLLKTYHYYALVKTEQNQLLLLSRFSDLHIYHYTTDNQFNVFNFNLPNKNYSINTIRSINRKENWLLTNQGLIAISADSTSVKEYLTKQSISDFIVDFEGGRWISTLEDGIFYMPNPSVKTNYNSPTRTYTTTTSNLVEYQNQLITGMKSGEMLWLSPSTLSQKKQLSPTHATAISEISLMPNHAHFRVSAPPYSYILNLPAFNWIYNGKIAAQGGSKTYHYNRGHVVWGGPMGLYIINLSKPPEGSVAVSKKVLPNPQQYEKIAITTQYKEKMVDVSYYCLRRKRVNTVLTDSSSHCIWVGYNDSLFYYKNGIPHILNDPQTGNAILATSIVKGNKNDVWVGTSNQGVYKVENYKITKRLHSKNHLLFNSCLDLALINDILWIANKQGIQAYSTTTQQLRHYNSFDGFPSDEIRELIIIDTIVCANTSRGLTSFPINLNSKNTIPPPIYLKKIKINNREIPIEKRIELPYNKNNIEVNFQGISYKSQGQYNYKYRFNSLDTSWQYQNANTNFIRVQGLQPNTYQLEIYAINEDGVESEQPIELTFVINPPFWATWWFRSLIGLAIAGFLAWQFLQFRRRQRLLLQLERLKNQALQAQMNPHFIFNAMNAIQQLMANSSMKEALAYMARFARLIRQIFEISGEPAINLEKEIDFLQLYLDLEQLRFKNKVEVDFVIDPALEEDLYSIPPLLIQPIIENCFKHGLLHKEDKGHLTVQLKKLGDFMYVLVEDDGVGRQRAGELQSERLQERKKSGLKVTRDRLLLLQQHPEHSGNILITDLQREGGAACGTRVELWIPFQDQNLEQL